MPEYKRYALYAMAEGALHDQASRWLGWDSRTGRRVEHPILDGLPVAQMTETPRKYGFHGTIKAPFALAEGKTQAMLEAACSALLPALDAAHVDRMEVRPLEGFVALVPEEQSSSLNSLASEIVELFDGFRAPLTEAELGKRRKAGLTAQQEANLQAWGYPYVMDDFRFHMTLTGRLEALEAEALAKRLREHLGPVIPTPFPVNAISLLGEDDGGMFHVVDTYPLADATRKDPS